MPSNEGFGFLPQSKDFVDVLANADRVIKTLSEYDRPTQDGQICPICDLMSEASQPVVAVFELDPMCGLSFLLALGAASLTKGFLTHYRLRRPARPGLR